ncbi:MAG: tetratricopeptide repeat protein [Terracidiphilus sp.]
MTPRFDGKRIYRTSVGLLLMAAVGCVVMGLRGQLAHAQSYSAAQHSASSQTADSQTAYSESAYSGSVDKFYSFRFGRSRPFFPSDATTATGQFIDPNTFPPAEYCGHCHQQAYADWRQSAHANSFRSPWYLKIADMLVAQKGVQYQRHCEGCHNPIALVSGALTPGSPVNRTTMDNDGITCSVCHSIQKVDAYGTGSYVLAEPAVLVDDQGRPIYGEVPDKEILTHLDWHVRAEMKGFYRTSEFCAACHKADMPREMNDYKWQKAFDTYDEWQVSSFAKQSPLPFYVKSHVSTCQSCHMAPENIETRDYGSVPGKFMSHRWLGANTLLARYYGYSEQLQKTMAFLRDGAIGIASLNVDLFGIERNGGKLIAPLGSVPFKIEPGDILTVSVVIQNKGIGHTLVPEQRDIYQCWVEFEAVDAAGHILMHSGALSSANILDPKSHSFTNRLVTPNATLDTEHEVWNTRIKAYDNTIQSGRAQVVRYRFQVPRDAVGPITITARVNNRRFNQPFEDFAVDRRVAMPVVEMASRTRTLTLGANPAAPHDAEDNPDWMRWNNYGIGLLDAQQYEASAAAFARVAVMRPDYADAYTNIAIADTAWERYGDARSNLEKALTIAPHNARALYYLALIERVDGHLDLAVADLREVTAQFPRSSNAHRELGFSLYQQHKYEEARTEYETVQSINPNDLSAHYILSIVYRRLGMRRMSAREAKAFADEKADPTATVYAQEFLRTHPDVASETVLWHVHSNVAADAGDENGGGGN